LQEFPADVVMLSSGGPDGTCYIDSCNLDGETNLKTRMSLQATKGANTPARVGQLGGKVEYEPPNSRLYSFSGRLEVQGAGGGGGAAAVDVSNVLLRGSTLRNTPWIMGLVVYTGQQTKMMMNATKKGKAKQSTVEKTVNFLLVGLLFFEVLAVTFCALGMYAHIVEDTQHWYIPYVAQDGWSAAPGGWFTFLILLNNYVPISLYISLEVAHLVQGMQIEWDECMYHHHTDTVSGSPPQYQESCAIFYRLVPNTQYQESCAILYRLVVPNTLFCVLPKILHRVVFNIIFWHSA